MRRSQKILLYSHDSFGLGHLRRALNVGHALLERFADANVLLASGSPCATHFEFPRRMDVVKLPSVTKDASGRVQSRSLDCDLAALVELRSKLLQTLVETYRPDLFIVDHRVLGLGGELVPVLAAARKLGTKTVLGVRDVIDSPEVVEREWGGADVRQALVEDYDRVCVYGDPIVFDPREEYPVPPELGERLSFTGYVVRPASEQPRPALPSLDPEVLVTVGGGEDGADRIDTYLTGIESEAPGWRSNIVLGPLLPDDRARNIEHRAGLLRGVRVQRFEHDLPGLLAGADAVVSMGGYNTTAEILLSRTPAVICPREHPRREQLLRAERLAGLGLVDCLPHPDPKELISSVGRAVRSGPVRAALPSMNGAANLALAMDELIGSPEKVLEVAS